MIRKIIYIVLVLVFICSCERRPLTYDYYPYADLTIAIDWSKSFGEERKPTGVSAWFYPKDGSKPIITYSSNVDEHQAAVPKGDYDVLVFNLTPTELSGTIGFRGTESLSTIEVYSLPTKELVDNSDRGLLVKEPEPFAYTIYRDLKITQEMVDDSKTVKYSKGVSVIDRTIRVTPIYADKRHKIIAEIEGYNNLAPNGTYAELYGLAEGLYLNTGKPNSTYVRQQFRDGWMQKSLEGEYAIGTVTKKYNTWGLASKKETRAQGIYDYWKGKIHLWFALVDDKTIKECVRDLDSSNLTIKTGYLDTDLDVDVDVDVEIEIRIKGDKEIVLPEVKPAEGGGSGFKPNVNPWDESEEDVEIPIK